MKFGIGGVHAMSLSSCVFGESESEAVLYV